MAKWGVPNLTAEFDELQEKYDQLLKDYEELKKNVTCDYYEAYLLEKKKVENLTNKQTKYQSSVKQDTVRNVAGWEYYND